MESVSANADCSQSNKLRTTGKESAGPELPPADTDDAVAALAVTLSHPPRLQQWQLTCVCLLGYGCVWLPGIMFM